MTQAQKVQEFLNVNRNTNSYAYLIKQTEGDYNPYTDPQPIDVSIQSAGLIEMALKDIKIIEERTAKLNARKGFKVGEFIALPDGQFTQITHVWEGGQLQTGGAGSKHLNSGGGISRSGSLDSGLQASDLIPTKETKKSMVWIFHHGYSGASRGVHAMIDFNVYKTKKGANLDGVPCIKEKIKADIVAKSETITRINGNGQPYTMHMPEIIMLRDNFKDVDFLTINQGETVQRSGLKFVYDCGQFRRQPMTKKQIDDLLSTGRYHAKLYNNCGNENKLYISPADNLTKRATLKFL